MDFAGPIRYRKSSKVEGKAYLVLYACSLSRALHLEVLPNLDTVTFLGSLKRLVARRGRPVKIFSDNGGTFIGAARWLEKVRNDEQLQTYLANERIHWHFNLSRAPWWGGQLSVWLAFLNVRFTRPSEPELYPGRNWPRWSLMWRLISTDAHCPSWKTTSSCPH